MTWYRTTVCAAFAVLTSAAGLGAVPSTGQEPAARPAAAPVAVQRVAIPETGFGEEPAMVLVGAALIGLAAAVRRAA